MADKHNFIPSVCVHPGKTLDEKLKEMGISVKDFSIKASLPEETVKSVINGDCPINRNIAIAFERVTEIPVNFWLTKQHHYDEYCRKI